MISFIKSIKYKFRFLSIRITVPAIFNFIFFFFPRKEKSLLIIKTDGIGDYVLFRNYLAFLKMSEKFKNYKIYLLTNITNKELAVHLDFQYVDAFLWYSDSYFLEWKLVTLLFRLQNLRLLTIIYINYSRKFSVDWIVNNINSKYKIGINGDTVNESSQLKTKTNKYYSKLINVNHSYTHEFEINKQIFEALTGEKCNYVKPFIDKEMLHIIPNESIVIFPGGSENSKRWPAGKFNELSKLITANLKTDVILTGGKDEVILGEEITKGIDSNKISNTISNLTLVELLEVIGGSKLLVSNDSVAIHIGVCLNIPVICISKGDLYGRFIPYPTSIYENIKNIIPESFEIGTDCHSQWSSSNINEIFVDTVFDAVQTSLFDYKKV